MDKGQLLNLRYREGVLHGAANLYFKFGQSGRREIVFTEGADAEH